MGAKRIEDRIMRKVENSIDGNPDKRKVRKARTALVIDAISGEASKYRKKMLKEQKKDVVRWKEQNPAVPADTSSVSFRSLMTQQLAERNHWNKRHGLPLEVAEPVVLATPTPASLPKPKGP